MISKWLLFIKNYSLNYVEHTYWQTWNIFGWECKMFLVYLKKLWLATKAATYTGLSTSLNEILKIFTISVTLKFSKFVMQCHINNLYFGKVMFWHILTIALHIFSMQWSGVDLEGVQGVWMPPTPCQIWEVPFYLGFLGFWQIYLGFFS